MFGRVDDGTHKSQAKTYSSAGRRKMADNNMASFEKAELETMTQSEEEWSRNATRRV
jgi:hypothetical protein